jgi:hypothetical protein
VIECGANLAPIARMLLSTPAITTRRPAFKAR